MRAHSRLPSGRLLVVLLAVILPLVAAAVGLLITARLLGISYWGTSVALIAGFPICIVATTLIGWWIHGRGDRRVAWWVLATAGSVLFYLLAVAIVTRAVAVQRQESILLDWLGLEALGGYISTFLLIQATLLVTRDQLASWHRRGRVLIIVLLGIGVGSFLAGAAMLDPDAPLDPLQAPLGDTWLAVVAEPASAVMYVAWILSVLVGPVALWREVGRSSGMSRRRLSIAAVVSLLPVAAIACCVLLLRALTQANLSEDAATSVIFTFFSLVIPLTAAGLAVAFSGEEGLKLPLGALKGALNIAVGLLVAVAAMTLSSVLAVRLAGGSVPLIVLLTAAVVAALWPVRRWAVRRLLLRADPRLAVAAGLMQRAEPTASSRPGHAVREVLRTALEDSSVDLAVRPRGGEAWVSVDGKEMEPPTRHPSEHLSVLTDSVGEPEAYVLHATTTADAAGIVAEVRPLLDRAVLEVTVRHQAEQLAAERARADSAATNERRRLERDLHDGVQGRLLSLALDLQAADAATDDGEAHLVLSDAVASLKIAMEEMRRLASGTTPELLGRDGLRAALANVVGRMPVPVSLAVPDRRFDPVIETTAYLVVTEAVTNSVKHAGRCAVDVQLTVDDGHVHISVADDGPGGADVRTGTGLRGLAERVQAAGGSLVVSDRQPNGTLVDVVLPCAQ